jgi:hypothetical protein
MRWLAFAVVVACAFVIACPPKPVTTTGGGEDIATRCEALNDQRGSEYAAFRHCRHWAMADAKACTGSDSPGCRCLCHLCDEEYDCHGGHCLEVPSTPDGDYLQRVCVHSGEPCWPIGKCPRGQACRNYTGHSECKLVTE